jgi:hypothetical protein
MHRKHRRPVRKPTELLLVPMIDIFTVLVTFLLMTAVFSRITIVELDLPSSQSTTASAPRFRLEVIVRKEGFELTNGTNLIATIPKVEGAYDLKDAGRSRAVAEAGLPGSAERVSPAAAGHPVRRSDPGHGRGAQRRAARE